MNILIINHYAGSKLHGMEYRPYYFAKEWIKNGHKVKLVAASYSHIRTVQPIVKSTITTESIDGIEYTWVKTIDYKGNGLRRFINMLSFVFKLFIFRRKIIGSFVPDVVIASSTYPLDIYPAKYYTKLFNAKLVFELHDLWPLSPMELGGMSKWNPFIMLMQHAENFAYKRSDYVISILPKALEHMMQHGLEREKFHYVPNGIDLSEWTKRAHVTDDVKSLIAKLKAEDKMLVAYVGAHGIANALDAVVDAMGLIKDKKISLILVGQGPEKQRLQQKVRVLGLNNILFIPTVNKEYIPELLSYFDVLFIGLQKQPLFRFGISPNKLMDYMMAGKPVIQAICAGNDIVGESGCGFSVEAENPNAIADAIIKMSQLSVQEREKMGKIGHEYITSNNTYEILARKFLSAIK